MTLPAGLNDRQHQAHREPTGRTGEVAIAVVGPDGGSIGGTGGTSMVDDAAFTPAGSSVTPAGGIVTADSVDSGDVGAFAMLANRQQKITLYDSSGAEITSFGGGTEYTEDAASAADPKGGMLILRRRDTLTGSEVSAESDNIAANATAKGELYVKQTDAVPVTDNGGNLSIDDGGNLISIDDGAGSITVDGTVTAANAAGDVAHDGVDSGNPVKIGGQARATQATAVSTSADRVNAAFDMHGNQFVRSGHQAPAATVWTAHHVPSANTVATISKAAAGAGVRNVCTELTIMLVATSSAPSAVQVSVSLIDGATGGTTYLWRAVISLPAVAGAANGITLTGLWLPGTANTGMTLEFSGAGGANTVESVSMSGVTVAE